MTVTPSGSTTNFSGVGAPNPKLTVPSLNDVEEPLATILRTIVAWLNNLSAPTSSGFYASLTGPGETTTPGELQQIGDFDIDGSLSVVQLSGSGSIQLQDSGLGILLLTNIASIFLESTNAPIELFGEATGAAGTEVALFTHSGNPNGVVTSNNTGDLCTDNSTPGLWIATAPGSTVWTAL